MKSLHGTLDAVFMDYEGKRSLPDSCWACRCSRTTCSYFGSAVTSRCPSQRSDLKDFEIVPYYTCFNCQNVRLCKKVNYLNRNVWIYCDGFIRRIPFDEREEEEVKVAKKQLRSTVDKFSGHVRVNPESLMPMKVRIKPRRVIFSGPATIVFWSDGDKTVVKCGNGEPYSQETGFAMACARKLFGNDHRAHQTIYKAINKAEVHKAKFPGGKK